MYVQTAIDPRDSNFNLATDFTRVNFPWVREEARTFNYFVRIGIIMGGLALVAASIAVIALIIIGLLVWIYLSTHTGNNLALGGGLGGGLATALLLGPAIAFCALCGIQEIRNTEQDNYNQLMHKNDIFQKHVNKLREEKARFSAYGPNPQLPPNLQKEIDITKHMINQLQLTVDITNL